MCLTGVNFVAKIVVFDSGLGSLSIIGAIRQLCKVQTIYFADSENFPYGEKSKSQLSSVINSTIKRLEQCFSPDLVVMASNTPSLVLDISNPNVITVKPPILEAKKISKTKNIGILATRSAIASKGLSDHIRSANIPKSYTIFKIDGSSLVRLVEDGKFLTNKSQCRRTIKKELAEPLFKNNIDTVTLSSTHLPFLKKLLQQEFPDVQFVEPGKQVAEKVFKKIRHNQSKRNSLKIFTSGNPTVLHKKLLKLKIKSKVNSL